MEGFTEKDRQLIRFLQDDLPEEKEPFRVIAKRLGMTEEQVVDRIEGWMQEGVIRRFGALVRHHDIGIRGNAMVAWSVPPSEMERIGLRIARYPFISHCYERPTRSDWPYNLYTMFHAPDREAVEALIRRVAEETGIREYRVLHTTKEWKKRSMKYL
ncbi:MAG: AsnC family transcriptional regulator [bacterium]